MLNGISIYHGVCHPPHGSASRAAEARCTSQAAPVINGSSASPELQPGHQLAGAARGIPATVPPSAPGQGQDPSFPPWGPRVPTSYHTARSGGSRWVTRGCTKVASPWDAWRETLVPLPASPQLCHALP